MLCCVIKYVLFFLVSIGFFDGIFIKPADMAEGSYYNETEKLWVWLYEDEDNEKHELFMDLG